MLSQLAFVAVVAIVWLVEGWVLGTLGSQIRTRTIPNQGKDLRF